MDNTDELKAGQQLGRYELLAQVARGGMGQVWAGRLKGARGFQKLVAIKTLLPELCNDKRIEQMLLEEARIASLIQHQNVVQTTELGEHHGLLYLVMEWLDGESLAFVLKRAEERKPMPLPVAVNLIAQACRGLHAAHELTNDLGAHLGVVHRDVSPHNVLVTHAGVVKLVDFGIAKAMNQDNESFTEHGEIKGKYSYMAPEQVLGEDVDRRADVFSIGITLYMATTGRHPFRVGDKANVIRAVTSTEPAVRPSVHVPSYPAGLEAVLMKALAKAPEDRYESAQGLRLALEQAVPEAFVPRFETQVREYLALVMGDRALARREALRRFQLAADERTLAEVQTGAQMPMASQSGGSLKAIVVDQIQAELGRSPIEKRTSQAPTAPGMRAPARRPYAALALAAMGIAALSFALVKVGHSRVGRASAAAPAPMATLPSLATAPPAAAPEAPAPRATATTPPAEPAASNSAIVKAPAPPVSAAPAASIPAQSHPAAPRSKKARKASSLDLMAPEYAN